MENCSFICVSNKKVNMSNIKLTVGKQVKEALDGRSNRWLSLKVGIPESELSKKINDKINFSDEEIYRINKLLKKTIIKTT